MSFASPVLIWWQVNAFADKPFAGNPAAVCVVNRARRSLQTDADHLRVAAELNQPVTGFVEPLETQDAAEQNQSR